MHAMHASVALAQSMARTYFQSQVLRGGSGVLLNLDRSFKVELAWLQDGAYKALGIAIKGQIVKCFATKGRAVTLAQCEARLGSLCATARLMSGD